MYGLEYYYKTGKARRVARSQLKRLPVLLSRVFKRSREQLMKSGRRALRRPGYPARSPEHRRLLRVLRRRFEKSVGFSRSSAFVIRLTGIPLEGLFTHISSQFKSGMSWENYGPVTWHIDHIKPCCQFDLTDPKQQAECFHFTNLQPLWAKENLTKGGRNVTLTQ